MGRKPPSKKFSGNLTLLENLEKHSTENRDVGNIIKVGWAHGLRGAHGWRGAWMEGHLVMILKVRLSTISEGGG